jgi:hypothetical protein
MSAKVSIMTLSVAAALALSGTIYMLLSDDPNIISTAQQETKTAATAAPNNANSPAKADPLHMAAPAGAPNAEQLQAMQNGQHAFGVKPKPVFRTEDEALRYAAEQEYNRF